MGELEPSSARSLSPRPAARSIAGPEKHHIAVLIVPRREATVEFGSFDPKRRQPHIDVIPARHRTFTHGARVTFESWFQPAAAFCGIESSRARAAASGTAKLAHEVGPDGHVLGEGNRALEAMAAFARVVS